MKINTLASFCVITDIYHEQQEITISNVFFTFLIQVSREKLQEIYSLVPNNKRSFLSRSGSEFCIHRWEEWEKGLLLLVLQQGEIKCRKTTLIILKTVISYHCHAYFKDKFINKLRGMTSTSKVRVKTQFGEHSLTSLNSAFSTQCPRVDCH